MCTFNRYKCVRESRMAPVVAAYSKIDPKTAVSWLDLYYLHDLHDLHDLYGP